MTSTIAEPVSPVLSVNASTLLTSERYDIPVKWRFIRHLAEGGDPDSERVYRWHIEKRTGGREPRSWKRSVDDYVAALAVLLAGMRVDGFDANYPVVLGANGRLRDGAHRVACALFLGLPVLAVTDPRDGSATWGLDWFRRHDMGPADLQRIEADWQWLKARSC